MSAVKQCRGCGRELDSSGFPVAPGRKRAKSDYCEDCWRWPLEPAHRAVVLRHRIERLARAKSIRQPSLIPGLVERVLAEEMDNWCAELAELEAEAA